MAQRKLFYNIEEMSELLGRSIASIYGYLARKDFTAVPMPMKLGRRLAWLCSAVDEWVADKARETVERQERYVEHMRGAVKRRGRKRKG
ncbi:helix-turn-helix domain-containing protein [Desulfovibrio sp. OttesenSCG-928-G15]|nr:helix-turn-helix domain-containing protein [Desulfovibrio sp. OttesenSCG-928-G15]